MSDWTWIKDNDASDLTGGDLLNARMVLVADGSGTITVDVPRDATSSVVWYSPRGEPGSTGWRAGEIFTVRFRVVVPNTLVTLTWRSSRIGDDGTLKEVYTNESAVPIQCTAGTKILTSTTRAQTNIAPSDRVRVSVFLTRDASIGSGTLGIGFGTSNDIVVAPITKAIGRYRASTIADADQISAVPSSVAMRAAVASLGMSATVVSMNPPSAASTSGGPAASGT